MLLRVFCTGKPDVASRFARGSQMLLRVLHGEICLLFYDSSKFNFIHLAKVIPFYFKL